jgi:ribosomal-protein-alanine N-acetyltransferase
MRPISISVNRVDWKALAELHRAAFAEGPERPWSAEALRSAWASARLLVCGARPLRGFALIRLVGAEAELLTLAVAPTARRRGVGRRLLAEAEAAAAGGGALDAYLEVAESNHSARSLYRSAGWRPVGRRRRYHPGPPPTDALVLSKSLGVAPHQVEAP